MSGCKDCVTPFRDAPMCPHAGDAAEATVKKVFAIMGVDINDPAEVEQFREDLRFGGKLRRAADKSFMVIVSTITVAVIMTMWDGIAHKIASVAGKAGGGP